MNKSILSALIGFFILFLTITGCLTGDKEKKIYKERSENHYSCPMKCTDQIFDKPGKCPSCGMDLIKITES
jgi:Cu(I)/Ag(I) efflux system membrane fusion protein